MKSLKIYIAGPYTGATIEDIETNVERAMDAGLQIWKKGHFPYIPHLTHWPDIRARELGIEMKWNDYMKWHAIWVNQCDALFLLGNSRGAMLEYEQAKRTSKIIFLSIDDIPQVDRSSTWADAYAQEGI